jgi:hypothetical protein
MPLQRLTRMVVRSATVLICCVANVACGDDEQGETLECQRADRAGSYVVHYEERAYKEMAMCGAIADTLGEPDDPSAAAADWGPCRLESSDWFHDDCGRELVYGCVVAQSPTDVGTSLVAVTYQKDSDGDRIEGLLTRIVYRGGEPVCRSGYDMVARRQ